MLISMYFGASLDLQAKEKDDCTACNNAAVHTIHILHDWQEVSHDAHDDNNIFFTKKVISPLSMRNLLIKSSSKPMTVADSMSAAITMHLSTSILRSITEALSTRFPKKMGSKEHGTACTS